ncbi:MAG: LolA family protein [Planctomycetota bacterium]|jgi:outer membrane lipoprotein-sorting protein
MNRNDRFDATGGASDEAGPEINLQSLFMRTAPDLGSMDVDALLASFATADGEAGEVPTSVGRRPTVVELATAALGLRKCSATQPERKMIMRARIAAVLLFAVGISALSLTLGHSGADSAFAAMQESLKEVRSVTFEMSARRGDDSAEVISVKLLGEDLGRAEHVSDGAVTVFDRKQRKVMNVMPDERKAIIFNNVEGENPIPNLFDMLLSASEKAVEELGDREIDGKTLKGFVAEFQGQRLDVWVDPATNLPVRMEQRHQPKEQPLAIDRKKRRIKSTQAETVIETIFDKFVYNSDLDPAQFRIEPPEGYQVEFRELLSVEGHARRAIERDRQALQRAREAAEENRRKNP